MSRWAGGHDCRDLETAVEQWRSGNRTTALLSADADPVDPHSDRLAHWRMIEHLGCDSVSRRRLIVRKALDTGTETELLEALYALGSPTAAFHLASRIGGGSGGPDSARRDELIAFAIVEGCPAAAQLLDRGNMSAAKRILLLRIACWSLLEAEWGFRSLEKMPEGPVFDLEPDALFSHLALELAEALPEEDAPEALLWCRRVEACAADPAEGAMNANRVRLQEAERWRSLGMTEREEAALRAIDNDAAEHAVGHILFLRDEHKVYRYDYQDALDDLRIWARRLADRARRAWQSGDCDRATTLVGCLTDLGTYRHSILIPVTELVELLSFVSPPVLEVHPGAPYAALDWLTRQIVPALADMLDQRDVSNAFALLPQISKPDHAQDLADAWTHRGPLSATNAPASPFADAVALFDSSIPGPLELYPPWERPYRGPGSSPEKTAAALDLLGLGIGDKGPDALFADHVSLLKGRLAASQPLWLSLWRRVLLDADDPTAAQTDVTSYNHPWERAWMVTSQAIYRLMEATLHSVLSDASAAGGDAFDLYLSYLEGIRPKFEEVVIPSGTGN